MSACLYSVAVLAAVLLAAERAGAAGPDPAEMPRFGEYLKVRPVPAADVRWTAGLWAEKTRLCREQMLPTIAAALADPNNGAVLENFRVAAGMAPGRHRGADWSDGDCYKYLEALAWTFQATGEKRLDVEMDRWITAIAAAQQPDGYLSTNIQLDPKKRRLAHPRFHEMYNMGHLLTAAAVHYRATGKRTLLDVARKAAGWLDRTFRPRPPRLAHFGRNPSNIMGLMDLYRVTGEKRWLELAGVFVDMRGSAPGGTDLQQDRVPLRKETLAVGHGVFATYLYSGAADLVAETGEKALLDALERIWRDMTTRRMYITGAIGSGRQGRSPRGDSVHEAFGLDYELPPRSAYNETCANIGNAMWARRMLALTGEGKYADLVERVLYNSALSAVAADGRGFFYCNPLAWGGQEEGPSLHHKARRWRVQGCYCCPPQLARTLAKLRGWACGVSRGALWVHLYGGCTVETDLPEAGRVRLAQQTRYPWDGQITLAVEQTPRAAWTLMLRIPGWAEGATATLNDAPLALSPAGGYAAVRRRWRRGDVVHLTLPMPARLMEAHPAVRSARGKVAVMRGPVVYCLESPDLPADVSFEQVAIPPGMALAAAFRPDLLGGVTVLTGRAVRAPAGGAEPPDAPAADPAGWEGLLYRPLRLGRAGPVRGEPVNVTLIPYFAWANRGISKMAVWLPLAR